MGTKINLLQDTEAHTDCHAFRDIGTSSFIGFGFIFSKFIRYTTGFIAKQLDNGIRAGFCGNGCTKCAGLLYSSFGKIIFIQRDGKFCRVRGCQLLQ